MAKIIIAALIVFCGIVSATAETPNLSLPTVSTDAVELVGNSESASTYWSDVFASSNQQEKIWAVACCKVCKKGKACGDSCISRSYNCTKGVGCACNGY
jgi:hypothetical protein